MVYILGLHVRYYLFWMLFFFVLRLAFVLYHAKSVFEFSFSEILPLFYYGLKLDNSLTCWILLPSILTLSLVSYTRYYASIYSIHKAYTFICVLTISILTTIDIELFTYWGFRLDNTFLRYLNTFSEAFGTSLSSPWYILLPLGIALFYYGYKTYTLLLPERIFTNVKIELLGLITNVIIASALIIPIRGGLQQIPINESICFYSNRPILNQAAINPIWTFLRSLIEKPEANPSKYEFNEAFAKAPYFPDLSYPMDTLLKTSRPNIILIIWESLTHKVFEPKVVPNLYHTAQEGLYFSNVYASGDRSDKGLVALLSAYPAQPDFSIMTDPAKSSKLQHLPKILKNQGYNSSFNYGGEPAFANLASYLSFAEFNQVISKFNYATSLSTSKWGVPDEHTFAKDIELANQLAQKGKPFFLTHFTLSSHEPFDVPTQGPTQTGRSIDQKFKNAHYYTDQSFQSFMTRARQQTWWDSTLIIIIADHGSVLPDGEYANHQPMETHIPMIWTGGALRSSSQTIPTLLSQTDLAAILLQQMKLPNTFEFSKGLYKDTIQPPAITIFNDGFAVVRSDSNFVVYDFPQNEYNVKKGALSPTDKLYGQYYIHRLMKDFLAK
ncbi:MAG: LTA synthase family protein [Cytophagaceae bacterium]